MKKYLTQKLIQLVVVMFCISVFSFAIIYVAPGDVATNYITLDMTAEEVAELRAKMGVDKGFVRQYLVWAEKAIQGDFGISYMSKQPVILQIAKRLPATLTLMGSALVLSIILAIVLGLWAGLKKGKFADYIISASAYVGMSMPSFWLGIMLIIIFTAKLGWLPSSGMHTPGQQSVIDTFKHMIMPTITLCMGSLASYVRYIRSNTIRELNEEYVLTAEAKGTTGAKLLYRHILKNTLLPIITLVGMNLSSLVCGSFIIESVFGWPGIGTLAMQAVGSRDYPVIMAYILLSGLILVLGNFLADILYAVVDPRIKREGDA